MNMYTQGNNINKILALLQNVDENVDNDNDYDKDDDDNDDCNTVKCLKVDINIKCVY